MNTCLLWHTCQHVLVKCAFSPPFAWKYVTKHKTDAPYCKQSWQPKYQSGWKWQEQSKIFFPMSGLVPFRGGQQETVSCEVVSCGSKPWKRTLLKILQKMDFQLCVFIDCPKFSLKKSLCRSHLVISGSHDQKLFTWTAHSPTGSNLSEKGTSRFPWCLRTPYSCISFAVLFQLQLNDKMFISEHKRHLSPLVHQWIYEPSIVCFLTIIQVIVSMCFQKSRGWSLPNVLQHKRLLQKGISTLHHKHKSPQVNESSWNIKFDNLNINFSQFSLI